MRRSREQARQLLGFIVTAAIEGCPEVVVPTHALRSSARLQRDLLREEAAERRLAAAGRARGAKAAREEKRSQNDARYRMVEGQIRRSHRDFGGTLGDAAIAEQAGVSRRTVARLRKALRPGPQEGLIP